MAKVRKCLYCSTRLPLIVKLKHSDFCTDEHRSAYFEQQQKLALQCLIETEQILNKAKNEWPLAKRLGDGGFDRKRSIAAPEPPPLTGPPAICGAMIHCPRLAARREWSLLLSPVQGFLVAVSFPAGPHVSEWTASAEPESRPGPPVADVAPVSWRFVASEFVSQVFQGWRAPAGCLASLAFPARRRSGFAAILNVRWGEPRRVAQPFGPRTAGQPQPDLPQAFAARVALNLGSFRICEVSAPGPSEASAVRWPVSLRRSSYQGNLPERRASIIGLLCPVGRTTIATPQPGFPDQLVALGAGVPARTASELAAYRTLSEALGVAVLGCALSFPALRRSPGSGMAAALGATMPVRPALSGSALMVRPFEVFGSQRHSVPCSTTLRVTGRSLRLGSAMRPTKITRTTGGRPVKMYGPARNHRPTASIPAPVMDLLADKQIPAPAPNPAETLRLPQPDPEYAGLVVFRMPCGSGSRVMPRVTVVAEPLPAQLIESLPASKIAVRRDPRLGSAPLASFGSSLAAADPPQRAAIGSVLQAESIAPNPLITFPRGTATVVAVGVMDGQPETGVPVQIVPSAPPTAVAASPCVHALCPAVSAVKPRWNGAPYPITDRTPGWSERVNWQPAPGPVASHKPAGMRSPHPVTPDLFPLIAASGLSPRPVELPPEQHAIVAKEPSPLAPVQTRIRVPDETDTPLFIEFPTAAKRSGLHVVLANVKRYASSRTVIAIAASVILVFALKPLLSTGPDRNSSGIGASPAGTWDGIRSKFAGRAGVRWMEKFDSGFDHWEGRGDPTKSWKFDDKGFVVPGQLAMYKPSAGMSDYEVEFLGQIERRALNCAFRIQDFNNYYAAKLVVVQPGPLPRIDLQRYAVINGKEMSRRELTIPLTVRGETLLNVRLEAKGSDFSVRVQDRIVDAWTDSRIPIGGIGFFSGKGERSRISWLDISHQYDVLGRICAYLSPSSVASRGTQ